MASVSTTRRELTLYTCEQVRELDRRSIEDFHVPGYELMRRAAEAAFTAMRQRWPDAKRIGVACGTGNNGGDGLLVALMAKDAGLDVHVLMPHSAQPKTKDAQKALRAWIDAGGRIEVFNIDIPEVDLWVDAIFGIGLNQAAHDSALGLIERINASHVPVLALDVPSGLNADTGVPLGTAIHATLTVSFIGAKRGLFTADAREYAGEVLADSLNVPEDVFKTMPPSARLLSANYLQHVFKPRRSNTHKGENGHVLSVGGERGMGGAVRLCAEAALRSGAGLSSVATRTDGVGPLLIARPEVMAHAVENADALEPLLYAADVVAVGPGLGRGTWGVSLFDACIQSGKPMVVDADALNILAKNPQALPQAVLTPHPGEAARLLDCKINDIQNDRFAAARKLAEKFDAVVVLKGAGSLVAAPDQTTVVIGAGNPGMAAGGMGDILTGVIAALIAQGRDVFEAATIGTLLHACAGDAAAKVDGERGMLPSDLFAHIRRLTNS
jgi:ADP-dependent NAD(P)H-hydrate dehydratase / NAD(P)H-hydrate epimerase